MSPVEFAHRSSCEDLLDDVRAYIETLGAEASLQRLEDVSRLALDERLLTPADVQEANEHLERLHRELRWLNAFTLAVKDAAP